ncbi:cell division protein ZipA [Pseudocolwellia agarivorans]|uniref:cell division protein ZipA n=1 Tax=Pseudocolwellia agarivorans TaxID=1911682 RepID=UPI0009876F81|nr:cell division protein ZipA [Pseudocolwellia agarivorans]
MEGNFRNTLIILSAVIIAVIFIHGFITIRKNKNPYKLKATNEPIEPIERGFDGSGFDQDGVSKPRVVGSKTPSDRPSFSDNEVKNTPLTAAKKEPSYSAVDTEIDNDDFDYSESSDLKITSSINTTETKVKSSSIDISLTDAGIEQLGTSEQDYSTDIGDDIVDFDYGVIENPDLFNNENIDEPVEKPVVIDKPLYDTPITQPKPQTKEVITTAKPKVKKKAPITKKEAVKRNQIELNFGDPVDTGDMPSMSAIDDPVTAEKQIKREPLEPEVLVVSVVMPQGEVISGAALLPTLLTLGLRYGDMDIFHRHQDSAGNGKVTFSLANIMNPGTFDLDALENFTTCGVTLFMTLPNAGDAFEVFEHMLGAAKQISIEFGAQLLDDKRSVMTKQTEQHYMSKIREFERKNRIALA